MKTTSNKSHIYIGREAGKEIHETIRGAKKSVKIVSPYISADYLKDLVNLHKKGVEITIITCDKISDSSYSEFRVSDLIRKEKIINNDAIKTKKSVLSYAILAFGVFLASLLFYLLSLSQLSVIFAGFLLVIGVIFLISYFSISTTSYNYESIFRIKVFDSTSGKRPGSTELIHSKIFIIDEDVAFLGSVNFTYSGFKTHYETTIKVQDARAVKDISEEVEMLYNSKELKAKSVEAWAGMF